MRCPFLREEQVKSCQAAPFRKSLARSAARVDMERCSSPAHASCPVACQSHEAHPSPSRCPFLQESLVQFCAATPLPTYVPWSSSPELRCGHGGHRYCELFAAAAGVPVGHPDRPEPDAGPQEAAGVPMPGWLWYAPSHLWLDPGDDGVCHVGIDAFVAQLVGHIDALAFLTPGGAARPAVVLSVHGVDLTLVFPRVLAIVSANTRLRSSLDRLVADPYGLGWLFEARLPADGRDELRADARDPDGLRRGDAARSWMDHEVRRTSEIVHAWLASRRGGRLAADGGRFAPDLLPRLDREQVLRLFAELFPFPESRRTS
jgi:glycine cleavage system H lipoate-binding protein